MTDFTYLFKITEIMTPPEASERWGLKKDTVRAALTRGKFNDQIERGFARKSHGTWLVSEQAMLEVYGQPKK